MNTHITFSGEPTASIRTITHAFNAIGYKLDVNSLSIEKNRGELSATAVGNKVFNASALGENLKEQGIVIQKAHLDAKGVVLELNTQNALWNIPLLEGDDGAELKRLSTSQWFRIEKVQSIHIQPPYAGKWYPDVSVLDTNMEVLSSLRSLKSEEELTFELPQGTRYLKISNTQGMKVLKEGLWIESVSSER